MWNAPTYLEVPTLIIEEWHHTLKRTKPESTANAQGYALLKEGGSPQAIFCDSLEM